MKTTNSIESLRQATGLTYKEIAQKAGFKSPSTVFHHCKGFRKISPEAALKYHTAFDIPLYILRPDLWIN